MKKKRIDKYEITLYFFVFLIMIFNIMLFVYRNEIIHFVDQRFGASINLEEISNLAAENDANRSKFLNTELLDDPRIKALEKNSYEQKNLVGENKNPFGEESEK